MPRHIGLDYRIRLNETTVPVSPPSADLVAVAALLPNLWCGAVRIGLSLLWDSPEISWYRRVPP